MNPTKAGPGNETIPDMYVAPSSFNVACQKKGGGGANHHRVASSTKYVDVLDWATLIVSPFYTSTWLNKNINRICILVLPLASVGVKKERSNVLILLKFYDLLMYVSYVVI